MEELIESPRRVVCSSFPRAHGHLRQIRRCVWLHAPVRTGGMQVFLYSTITVAGVRVLSLAEFTRRNRFILTTALGIGFMDIVSPSWFDRILDYEGSNMRLQGFEQGINLVVETPFIIAAVVGVVLNLLLPYDVKVDGRERPALPT